MDAPTDGRSRVAARPVRTGRRRAPPHYPLMAQGHSPVTAAAGDGMPDATFPDVPWLLVRGLRFAYGPDQRPVVDIDELEIEPGSLVAITGPSGSGKTSLLYLLTGVEPTQAGTVRWGDVDLAGLREAD